MASLLQKAYQVSYIDTNKGSISTIVLIRVVTSENILPVRLKECVSFHWMPTPLGQGFPTNSVFFVDD